MDETEELLKKLRECFQRAKRDEKEEIKHKGLLMKNPNIEESKKYIQKAKESLDFCEICKQRGYEYKIPEEWFYTLYYCALAILSKIGIETRSQKYTSLILQYFKNKNLIDYEQEFISRIRVYTKKGEESEVDEREEARYSSAIKIEKVNTRYKEMTLLCKRAIEQSEEIIYSNKTIEFPKELLV
ncbi:MAG: hypothetical protein AABX11_07760 [Nanoarchaeota archaeon]